MKPGNSEPLESTTTITRQRRGFTLLELLVVIAIIAILAGLLLPVLARTKDKALGIKCLNNQHELIRGALMYADENNDWWVPNQPGQKVSWCAGILDGVPSNTDNTNSALLLDPKRSVLGPYIRDARMYHCPVDRCTVPGEGDRVRSIAMNGSVGSSPVSICGQSVPCPVNGQWLTGFNIGLGCQTKWRTYGKTSQMTLPGPSDLFCFIDECKCYLNDATFHVQMVSTGTNADFIDPPAPYHNDAAGVSFCDGHAELHKLEGATVKSFVWTAIGGRHVDMREGSGDSWPVVLWLQQHSSAPTGNQ